jgi:hypothetical protein
MLRKGEGNDESWNFGKTGLYADAGSGAAGLPLSNSALRAAPAKRRLGSLRVYALHSDNKIDHKAWRRRSSSAIAVACMV